ncbi:MAG TPA: hypothetical protein VH397_00715 [Xanthobacteraceae bacterium]
MAGVLLREQEFDLLQAFAETRLRLVRRDAEAAELVRQEGARKADVEPPARDAVEHRDLARELEGMIEHRQHRAGDETQRRRALRDRGEKDDRVRAVAAVAREVVLDGARVGEAELLRFLRDRKRLRVIVGGALVGVIDGGKKLHTELHLAPSFRPARVECPMARDAAMSGTIGRHGGQSIEPCQRAGRAMRTRGMCD